MLQWMHPGNRTGYSLTVTKHYRSIRERDGEFVNEGKFVYSFALMDLSTRMYVGYAVSMIAGMHIARLLK